MNWHFKALPFVVVLSGLMHSLQSKLYFHMDLTNDTVCQCECGDDGTIFYLLVSK